MPQHMQLTEEQRRVSDAIMDFARTRYSDKRPYICVAGYAGTGKTTVMGYTGARLLREHPYKAIYYCAPTAKAANVLKGKLYDFNAMNDNSSVRTVHGHIYNLHNIVDGEMRWDRKDDIGRCGLFVVDEASMITQRMFRDLLSFKRPIIFIGDPCQLPPVGDQTPFSPLMNTDLVLKTVHRQALDNPIISVATDIRNGVPIPFGWRGDSFFKAGRRTKNEVKLKKTFIDTILTKNNMILCGINSTRVNLNMVIREALGCKGDLPNIGERLLCLENNWKSHVFNGQIYAVRNKPYKYVNEYCYVVDIGKSFPVVAFTKALNISNPKTLKTLKDCYACELNDAKRIYFEEFDQDGILMFDYGYACSVHKAQGSEWDNVLLYDERMRAQTDEQYMQWLYTGVTRAKKKLCVIS